MVWPVVWSHSRCHAVTSFVNEEGWCPRHTAAVRRPRAGRGPQRPAGVSAAGRGLPAAHRVAEDGWAWALHLPQYRTAEVVADPKRSYGLPIFAHRRRGWR